MESEPNKIENFGIILKDVNNYIYDKIEYNYENIPNDYCLIENKACGLGPYDTGFIIGRLQVEPKREFNLGCEGSGIVVKVGANCSNDLIGKKVAYLAGYQDPKTIRSFANYSVVNINELKVLNDKISFEQGAYLLGNPLTAKGLFDAVISTSKTKAIVCDTSSSALVKMITKLCIRNKIKIINIVRKAEDALLLEKIGSEHNLDSSDKSFLNELDKKIKEINPDIYITFQGGNLPSRILDKMPFDSRMVSCGNINNQKLFGFSTTDFIFKGKSIEGFQILNYIKEISNQKRTELYDTVMDSLIEQNENSEYFTNIYKEYDIKDFDKGYKDYENNASFGKIIFRP